MAVGALVTGPAGDNTNFFPMGKLFDVMTFHALEGGVYRFFKRPFVEEQGDGFPSQGPSRSAPSLHGSPCILRW